MQRVLVRPYLVHGTLEQWALRAGGCGSSLFPWRRCTLRTEPSSLSWAAHEPGPHRLCGRSPFWPCLPRTPDSRCTRFTITRRSDYQPRGRRHRVCQKVLRHRSALLLATEEGREGPQWRTYRKIFRAVHSSRDAQNYCHLLGANVRGSIWPNCWDLYFCYREREADLRCGQCSPHCHPI